MRHHFLRAMAGASVASYDADAQAMFDKRVAVSDAPSAAYMQAISDYVTAIKAVSGLWDGIIQIVVLAGATTVNGARQSIKGLDLVNGAGNFVNGDINIKTGSIGNGSTKYWDTGYTGTVAGTGQNNFHIYGYFPTIVTTSPAFFGNGGSGSGAWSMRGTLSRSRSGSNNTYFLSSTTGGFGMNRSVSDSYERIINNAAPTTVTQSSGVANASPYYIHAVSGNAVATPSNHSSTRCLVYIMGASIATLADYTAPTDALFTALDAI